MGERWLNKTAKRTVKTETTRYQFWENVLIAQ
ncbi:hypothetical protein ES703_50168 [subsurface metagenome]